MPFINRCGGGGGGGETPFFWVEVTPSETTQTITITDERISSDIAYIVLVFASKAAEVGITQNGFAYYVQWNNGGNPTQRQYTWGGGTSNIGVPTITFDGNTINIGLSWPLLAGNTYTVMFAPIDKG